MRYIKLIIVLLVTSLLTSCIINDPKYINFKTKPNDYYYSNEIYYKVKNSENFKLQVFDTNLYKYYDVPETDYDILVNFFSALKKRNYLTELASTDQAKYEIIINFAQEKYIINVYNEAESSVYPWDGCFNADIIDTSEICAHDNLYYFCKYVINEAEKQSYSQ